MTNIEHRIQRLNQVIPPLGATMPDWNILEELSRALGRSMGYFSVNDVFREMALTIPFYKGLRFRDLGGDGKIIRPEVNRREGSRPRPYTFAPVRTSEAVENDTAIYPFELMAGRSMYHFGSTTTRSRNLLGLAPQAFVEVNPIDAMGLGIGDGDPIEVTSPAGSVVAPARLSSEVEVGRVVAPVNFPEVGVYKLFRENTTVCRVKLTIPEQET